MTRHRAAFAAGAFLLAAVSAATAFIISSSGASVVGAAVIALEAAPVYAVMIAIGLTAGRRLGIGAPVLEGLVSGNPPERTLHCLAASLGIGVLIGAVLSAAALALPRQASFGAWSAPVFLDVARAVCEEVLLRLVMVVALARAAGMLFKDPDGRPKPSVVLAAIIVVAFLSVLDRIPVQGASVRTLVEVGVPALIYGLLLRRGGVEAALLAHATAAAVAAALVSVFR